MTSPAFLNLYRSMSQFARRACATIVVALVGTDPLFAQNSDAEKSWCLASTLTSRNQPWRESRLKYWVKHWRSRPW